MAEPEDKFLYSLYPLLVHAVKSVKLSAKRWYRPPLYLQLLLLVSADSGIDTKLDTIMKLQPGRTAKILSLEFIKVGTYQLTFAFVIR